jgi:hypothetical protein
MENDISAQLVSLLRTVVSAKKATRYHEQGDRCSVALATTSAVASPVYIITDDNITTSSRQERYVRSLTAFAYPQDGRTTQNQLAWTHPGTRSSTGAEDVLDCEIFCIGGLKMRLLPPEAGKYGADIITKAMMR